MKLYYLDNDDLNQLKGNVEPNLENYRLEDNKWIVEQLGEGAFKEFYKDAPDFELDPQGREIDNVRKLYTNLKNITPSEASEERLWAGLSHSVFWDFMRESLKYDIETNARNRFNESTILNRYFFNMKSNARKRSMYISTLSKLWWVGHLCYNEQNQEDSFEYLKLFETAFSHKVINTFSSNIMAKKNIRFAVFDSALSIMEKGAPIKADTMTPMIKHMNEQAGLVLLDSYNFEHLKDIMDQFVRNNIDLIMSY